MTMITGQGFITAFGTKPSELPSAGGKPSNISYCQMCAEEEAVGSTWGSHHVPSYDFPSSYHLF